MTLLTFLVYGWDKHLSKSKGKKKRIPEKRLLMLAAVGGAFGAAAAMLFFRHKTLHRKFTLGIPAIIMAHILLLYRYFR